MKNLFLVIVSVTSCRASDPLRFDHFKVHRTIPQTKTQLQALTQLEEDPNGMIFWKRVSKLGQPVDIMVPPHLKYNFEDFIHIHKLHSHVWIHNVQKLIDNEKSNSTDKSFNWNRYQHLHQIYSWMRSLATAHRKTVTVIQGGRTYEGRPILGVKISFKLGNKGVFLEGGIHACEWIAPAILTYAIHEVLNSTDHSVRAIAESRDWFIFPVINPDGYVYSHTRNRFWRKTRKPYGSCVGADPNRNWGYHWMDGGASNNSCKDTYAGTSAFSEVETKSLSRYINSISPQLDIYLSFHSYSQLLLIPFGHAGREKPANNAELHTIGKNAARKLEKRYGTKYKVGNIPDVIYVASGGSVDWVMGLHKHIRVAYTYELRDKGTYGFILPPSQIIPTGKETFDSIISIIEQVNSRKKNKSATKFNPLTTLQSANATQKTNKV